MSGRLMSMNLRINVEMTEYTFPQIQRRMASCRYKYKFRVSVWLYKCLMWLSIKESESRRTRYSSSWFIYFKSSSGFTGDLVGVDYQKKEHTNSTFCHTIFGCLVYTRRLVEKANALNYLPVRIYTSEHLPSYWSRFENFWCGPASMSFIN